MAPPKHNSRTKETKMKIMKSIKTKIGTAPLLLFLRLIRFSWTRDWGIIRDQGEPGVAKGRVNDQVMGRGTPGETEGGRRPATLTGLTGKGRPDLALRPLRMVLGAKPR